MIDPDPRYVDEAPVRRAPDVIHHQADDEAFASARAVAIVLVAMFLAAAVITIVLVSGRPPQ